VSERANIDLMIYLMFEAFDAPGNHPLLSNIGSLQDDDWLWTPPGGKRTIFEIVQHIGECKYVYENHAFGDGSMSWISTGAVPSVDRDTPHEQVVEWLREGHRRLVQSVAALADDGELLRPRRANWGTEYETRWLINAMIQHDLYHAGEINHIRALRHENDRWAYDET
jgi:hypothetical protein